MYTVYKHTSPSGKVYIGITSTSVKQRWKGGSTYVGQPFYNAIKKYGWSAIKHEILFDGLTKEQACKKEIELIALYKATDPQFGYNATTGGTVGTPGHKLSEQGRERIRLAALRNKGGKPVTNTRTVEQLLLDGEVVAIWKNVVTIRHELGYSDWSIAECCRGRRKTAYGFKWRYATSNNE